MELSTSVWDSFRWMWMPVPSSSASSRAAQQLLGEGQPLDPDVDLDATVSRAVVLAVGRASVLQCVQTVLVIGDVVREHRADPDLFGRSAQGAELRYMSFTVVTPPLIDSK